MVEIIDGREQYIKASSEPSIFYFTASWCGPCTKIKPYYYELEKKYPLIRFYLVDFDNKNNDLLIKGERIDAIPTFHYFDGTKKWFQFTGADRKNLKLKLNVLSERLVRRERIKQKKKNSAA